MWEYMIEEEASLETGSQKVIEVSPDITPVVGELTASV
jgi:hypothetical protein